MPTLRTAVNYDSNISSFKSGLDCSSDPSRAQQHMRDECDINVLVNTFMTTGHPPPLPFPEATDFHEIYNFQDAQNTIIDAQKAFMSLPSRVRNRFNNDPGQFLNFFHDPANTDECIALGLATARPTPPTEPPQGGSEPGGQGG